MKLREYPFWNYINEDKSHYPHAKDNGYHDPTDSFLIGESGGFLLNINPKYRFVNTHLLTPAVNEFEKNGGKYTLFNEDSIPHINFRKQETIRRMVGYKAPCKLNTETGEVEDLYITGEHYNFINYGRILKLDTKTLRIEKGKVTGKKILGFPRFIDCQWWYFIIKQFCKDNGFFLINDKTRRGGFSYMEAIGSANYINLVPNRSVIHAAADNKFLIQSGGLSDFMKKQIIFYESHTPFARGIAKIDSSDFILGFKDQSTGVVDTSSWNSACISVSTNNNPSAAVGKDAGEIKCEEMSEFENFDDFMDVTTPTLKTGSVLTGFLNAWGTAGKANKGWAVFEQNFYDPRSGSFMPFENVWDKDSRDSVCGYFKPYCWGLEGYKISKDSSIANLTSLDKDGNSDVALGFKIAEEERAAEKKNSKSLSILVIVVSMLICLLNLLVLLLRIYLVVKYLMNGSKNFVLVMIINSILMVCLLNMIMRSSSLCLMLVLLLVKELSLIMIILIILKMFLVIVTKIRMVVFVYSLDLLMLFILIKKVTLRSKVALPEFIV